MVQPPEDSPATTLGGFFALRWLDRAGDLPQGAVSLSTLYAGDTAPLAERVSSVRSKLGASEDRVAASLAYQGLAARIWSVSLAASVLGGGRADLPPSRLYWDPHGSAPQDLWLLTPPAEEGTTDAAVAAAPSRPCAAELTQRLATVVNDGHLAPLAAATRQVTPVSERLLWGNAASALGGALRPLTGWLLERGRDQQARLARELVTALLAEEPLRGTGTLHGLSFTRNTCCLFYRAPSGGLCGDCVFRTAEGQRPPRRPRPTPRGTTRRRR